MMIEKIKNHWEEHKEKYYIGATCLTGGILIGLYLNTLKPNGSDISNMVINKQGLAINSPITTQIQVMKQGNSGNVIQCDQTGTTYMSQGQAAKEMGLDAGAISKHMMGKSPHVKGYTFTKLLDGLDSQE